MQSILSKPHIVKILYVRTYIIEEYSLKSFSDLCPDAHEKYIYLYAFNACTCIQVSGHFLPVVCPDTCLHSMVNSSLLYIFVSALL